MAIRKSSSSGIPFGNTAGRPASPTLGQLYSNGQVGRLELYTSTGWQNIVQETPGIAGVTGTYNESAGSGTFVISGTNFVDGGLIYAVGTNAVEYQATTSTYNSIVQMTALFTGLSPAYEPYDIKVVNPSNLFGLLPDAFFINDSPVWSTASGSLGSYQYNSSANIQLSATDDESNSLTYSVVSGSLPAGLSLSSAGLISGTVTVNPATYTFTVSVTDGINTSVTRSFSIIVPAPTVTGGTLSSDSTYYYRTFTATGNLVISNSPISMDILTVGGGGGGARPYAGGGGAGGATLYTSRILNAGTTLATIGGGGAGGTGGGNHVGGTVGVSSQFGSLVSGFGGGSGAHYNTGMTGGVPGAGGSGGGAGGESNPSTGGASNQTSSASGYVSYGNSGGSGSTSNIYRGGGGGGLGSSGSSGTDSGSGGSGSNVCSSWLSTIAAQMTGVSGWSTATATGYIGGGGGGGAYSGPAQPAGVGGIGGGGSGGFGSGDASQGITNTGSGGGGAGGIGNGATGGGNGASGGSGLIIVRYTKASVGG